MTVTEYEAYRQQWHRERDMIRADLAVKLERQAAASTALSYKLAAARARADEVCGRIYEDCC